MPSIICPCIECIHHPKKSNYCNADKIILAERWMHTVNEGYQHFWACKDYQAKDHYGQFIHDLRMALGDPEEEEN